MMERRNSFSTQAEPADNELNDDSPEKGEIRIEREAVRAAMAKVVN
jgi:hypothetical protein